LTQRNKCGSSIRLEEIFFNPIGAIAGTPAVWILDLNDNAVKSQYFFPDDVVSSTTSFLNDIVVDESTGLAYLSDAWSNGAIIVLDMTLAKSRRYQGASTKNDPNYALIVNGINYGTRIFTTPTDGIALTSDNKAVFYSQVQGTSLYRLPTSILGNFSASNSQIDAAVERIGTKEPSDGLKYVNGRLFWGALTTSTFFSLEINSTSLPAMSEAVAAPINQEEMQWIDTFSVDFSDQSHKLWFVSNRLDRFTVGSMDFSGKAGANMRILTVDV